MKNYSNYWLIIPIVIALFFSCNEYERGQIPLDSIPPQQINSVSVENIPGGAVISYIIPEDEDLLYVKAIYTLDNGKLMEEKVSTYDNKLKIVGFGKSKKRIVKIVTGDRSKNESKPIEVEIFPLDAPIYDILNSIIINNDFGGILLRWNNTLKSSIIIDIDTLDSNNKYINAERIYTNSEEGIMNLRGYAPVETVFAVSIRDLWGNTTDTISGTYLPMEEWEIDKSKFARWNPPGIPYQQLPNYSLGGYWVIENLWDGSLDPPGYSWPLTAKMGDSFTFDLGQLVKLSRFEIFQRNDTGQLYTGSNIKSFEFFGSPHKNVSEDENTWIYIGSYESIKPSGLPMGQVSDEDYLYAMSGESYKVDLDIPPVRYVRFKINKTWGGSNFQQTAEMSFFGTVIEDE